jgi:hypothetical protein
MIRRVAATPGREAEEVAVYSEHHDLILCERR